MPESLPTARSGASSATRLAKRTDPVRRRRSPKIQTVLDHALYVRLQARAAKERRSVSQMAKFLIEAALALDA
jgi:hypothetical protein